MKNTTYEVKKSEALLKKAKEVIPGGIFGHYKYAIRDTGPKFFSHAEGAYFWDVDDNKYIDLMCAYGPSIQVTNILRLKRQLILKTLKEIQSV